MRLCCEKCHAKDNDESAKLGGISYSKPKRLG